MFNLLYRTHKNRITTNLSNKFSILLEKIVSFSNAFRIIEFYFIFQVFFDDNTIDMVTKTTHFLVMYPLAFKIDHFDKPFYQVLLLALNKTSILNMRFI